MSLNYRCTDMKMYIYSLIVLMPKLYRNTTTYAQLVHICNSHCLNITVTFVAMSKIKELSKIPFFSQLTEEELIWISESSSYLSLTAGEVIVKPGDMPDGLFVILEGKIEWTQQVSSDYHAYVVTLEAGELFAELLLITNEAYSVTGRATTTVRLCKLPTTTFWELLHRRKDIMQATVRLAASRSRMHEAMSQQQAKLVSLGTMAAGLAHELNNPAAAIQRSNQSLREAIEIFLRRSMRLNQRRLECKKQNLLKKVATSTVRLQANRKAAYNSILQAELEDVMTDWLKKRDIEEVWNLSPLFVEAGLTIKKLSIIEKSIPKEALGDSLKWVESAVSIERLLSQIQRSSSRLSEVIGSVKSYSYMDRSPLQEIDISKGIKDTLAMMSYKLKQEKIEVNLNFDLAIPKIYAYGADLNQVWTNLIDNAIDALREEPDTSSKIRICTRQEPNWVIVEIIDNGVGMREDAKSRLFEPFFTTKEIGEGSGLGLDICKRIVEGYHKGSIRFESKPGRTIFDVRIPSNSSDMEYEKV